MPYSRSRYIRSLAAVAPLRREVFHALGKTRFVREPAELPETYSPYNALQEEVTCSSRRHVSPF